MKSEEDELALQLKQAGENRIEDSRITITPGLAGWMLSQQLSLAFTSYQTGQLILAGVAPDGRVSFNEQNYARATGLCYHEGRLHVGSMFQIWRLANMLESGQFAQGAYDCVFVPRNAHSVNYVDTHEIGIDTLGRTIFVNSRYSCLATLDERHSFRPIWKPPFITALAAEDRCHLNGMAMVDGRPAYVTAISASDSKEGWRDQRHVGGLLIDVESGETITDRLSMPHSPRVHDGHLWALDSGRGMIVTVDRKSGRIEDVAFCPGFLRGLEFHNGYALMTVSKARDGGFKELPLQSELDRRNMTSACGVLIVELASGRIAESILFDGKASEMFGLALLPGIRNPMSIGPATVEMIGAVSFSKGWAQL